MQGLRVRQTKHSTEPGYVTAIYGPDDKLLRAGYELSLEEGLQWAHATLKLREVHPTLWAPDAKERRAIADEDNSQVH